MHTINVRASEADDARVFTGEYEFGSNLEEMVKRIGAEIVYNHAVDNMTIKLQGKIRSMLKKDPNISDATLKAMLANYKFELGRQPTDPAKKVESITKGINSLPADERAKLIRELMNSMPEPEPTNPEPELVKSKPKLVKSK